MSDYIRREDALKAVDDIVCDADDAERTCDRIIDLPSADVAPVRHAYWIKISLAGIYECSECGKNVMTSDIEAYKYCHGCGAIMDGEANV